MGLTIAVCICEKDKSFVIWQQITNNQVQVYYSVDSTHEHLIVFFLFWVIVGGGGGGGGGGSDWGLFYQQKYLHS